MPEDKNHFSGVFVFHKESGAIHIDDTIMVGSHPGILLKLAGKREGRRDKKQSKKKNERK
jgi:hypothetical protein